MAEENKGIQSSSLLTGADAVLAAHVLQVWYNGKGPEDIMDQFGTWWKGNDDEFRDKFQEGLERVVGDEDTIAKWSHNIKDRLALVIMCDQLSRSIYRGQGKAFANDALAQRLVKEAIDSKEDVLLDIPERCFLYMPLLHAENKELNQIGTKSFTQLDEDKTKSKWKDTEGLSFTKYMLRHAAVVSRFGRYPMRNKALGRDNTADEDAYIKEKGEGAVF